MTAQPDDSFASGGMAAFSNGNGNAHGNAHVYAGSGKEVEAVNLVNASSSRGEDGNTNTMETIQL